MGTLGGGNHFIEVCLDEHEQVWVMLHSGRRGIGNAIATYFIELARKDMARHMIHLPDRDLAYFACVFRPIVTAHSEKGVTG
ncbi:MAG TPA: RtcB family protein, partial [Thauera sp.]|nr:RtcB family protein [Thauera sp.]